jgi:hypothetical protein
MGLAARTSTPSIEIVAIRNMEIGAGSFMIGVSFRRQHICAEHLIKRRGRADGGSVEIKSAN